MRSSTTAELIIIILDRLLYCITLYTTFYYDIEY